jgi:hypothetical protein
VILQHAVVKSIPPPPPPQQPATASGNEAFYLWRMDMMAIQKRITTATRHVPHRHEKEKKEEIFLSNFAPAALSCP